MVNPSVCLWSYLSKGQKGLIEDGLFLLDDSKKHRLPLSDFSYIVFPFAKAYEGFLKQLFLDAGFINPEQYESDHFRIGKALNPNFAREVPEQSVYLKINNYTKNNWLAESLWNTWKRGRNLLFHYFPHNLKSITIEEADELTRMILGAMEKGVSEIIGNK